MRCVLGFVCVLALGLMGCSETAGNGLSRCYALSGAGGFGGGHGPVQPGLWLGGWGNVGEFESDYAICFYVNDDCTALMATTACDIDRDDEDAHFLEIQWRNDVGIDQNGAECSAGVGVTPDKVTEVPLNEFHKFTIEFTDDDGGEWSIEGDVYSGTGYTAVGTARRTSGSTYCEIGDGWMAFN